MKSLQIAKLSDRDCYSELTVLRSQAGWYVGTSYNGEPGSRDSGYHPNEAAARQTLDGILRGTIKPRLGP